jgi:hypothetical protein
MRRLLATLGWTAFGLVTTYALALSVFAFVHPGWKPHRVETAWFVFAFAFLVGLAGALRRTSGFSDVPSPPRASGGWWSLAAAMAVTLVAYSRGLFVGFLSDDFVLLEIDDFTGWRQGTSQLFRLLPIWMLQAADGIRPSLSPVIAHILSLTLHVANGALLHAIALRLRLEPAAAVLAAALFLLFPASAEAVVWASGLQDVLMATASLGLVLATLDARHPALLFACVLAGLLSKETAVVMPLLAAAALWARGTKPAPVVARTLVACALVAAAFGLWRIQSGVGTFAVPPTRYLIKEILATAFGTLAVPWTTDELRAAPLVGIVMASTVALGAWTIVLRAATIPVARVAVFGVAWVILSVAPVYSLFFVSNTLEGSRYLYLPSAGWAVLLASAAALATSRRGRLVRWALCVVAALWAVVTYAHVAPWRRAAAERDRVLNSATAALASDCGSVAFVGATDNVSGAYVFRNGLAPALRREGARSVVDQAETATCVFTWTGETFVRTR